MAGKRVPDPSARLDIVPEPRDGETAVAHLAVALLSGRVRRAGSARERPGPGDAWPCADTGRRVTDTGCRAADAGRQGADAGRRAGDTRRRAALPRQQRRDNVAASRGKQRVGV